MQDVCIFILAAGLGTRMRSNKPKVLFDLCGKTMIEHILDKAYKISEDVNVILYHQFEEIKDQILKKYPNTKIFKQDLLNYPGTAGALQNIEFKKEKIVILCGDMPLIEVSDISNLLLSDDDLRLCAFKTNNPKGYGRILLDNNNKVKNIVEEKDASEDEKKINLVNAGCYAFKKDALNKILPLIKNNNSQKEYYLTDAIHLANSLGFNVGYSLVNEQNFMGINDKFALSTAENIMQNKIKKDLMLEGIYMRMPNSIYIDARAKFAGECEIEENVSIIGECEIKNSIIKSSSVIENSKITDSSIGPLAHIRPNCEIKNSHIGNFVELKSAKVNGIKAGHLSYLGDCEINEGTNIGCGTITCNYDGKTKHKTIIGKNVFVGSDTQFVAPVNIEDDTIIASGSTITKNVKKGELAISRGKQINKKDFFYKFFGENNEK